MACLIAQEPHSPMSILNVDTVGFHPRSTCLADFLDIAFTLLHIDSTRVFKPEEFGFQIIAMVQLDT